MRRSQALVGIGALILFTQPGSATVPGAAPEVPEATGATGATGVTGVTGLTQPTARPLAAGEVELFHAAYYAESAEGDPARAAELYAQCLAGGELPAELQVLARERLAGCREEIASAEFANLMPPDPWAYVVLDRPGEHVLQLLGGMGLLRDGHVQADRKLALSPELVQGVLGIRGAALAVTGFNPVQGVPSGVLVFHPGDLDVVRGLLETALPAAVSSSDTLEGRALWKIENKLYVVLTQRLVIASAQKSEIARVLRRLDGQDEPSLRGNERVFAALTKQLPGAPSDGKNGALLSFVVNPKPMLPLLRAALGATQGRQKQELEQLRALVDPEHLESLAGRLSVTGNGVGLDLALALEEGHENLVFNLLRTPELDRRTLERIPAEAAAFAALALNPFDPERRPTADPAAVSGLDLGRELFGNLAAVALFALPPASGSDPGGASIPDVGAILTVNDPAKSEALWSLLLGVANLVQGGALESSPVDVAGRSARTWQFAQGPRLHVLSLDHEILLGTSARVLERVLDRSSERSIFADPAYARALAACQDGVNQLVLVRPARVYAIARQHLAARDRDEADPLAELAPETVVGLSLTHSKNLLALRAGVTGLPAVGELVESRFDEFVHAHGRRATLRAPRPVGAVRATAPQPTLLELFWLHARQPGDDHASIALELGSAFVESNVADSHALGAFASALVAEAEGEAGVLPARFLGLASQAAELANEATGFQDPACLEVLARVELARGSTGVAADLVQQAVSALAERGGQELPQSLAALRERCEAIPVQAH